jgi:argininosuccinate lyase
MNKTNQSWGGRFNQPTDEFVKIFGASVFFDKILAPYDIQGSIAHATMLQEVGLLTEDEKSQIIDGLNTILTEIEKDKFDWSLDLEDVHMNIEARLVAMIGDAGKKLHTGRSRNDQVATDIRLYLREQLDKINVHNGKHGR